MKFSFKPLFRNLSGILNFVWYTGVAVSAIALIAIVIFLISSLGSFNLKVPAASFQAGNFIYKFNTKYLEVINTEDIVRQYKQLQMGKLLTTDTWEKKSYESLYNFKFPPPIKHTGINMDGNPPGYFLFDDNMPLNFSGIFELKNVPVFPVSFSLMIISFLFFGLIILFNVRKILSVNSVDKMFTNTSSDSIRYIGLYILFSEAVRILLFYWTNRSIAKMFHYSQFDGMNLINLDPSYFISWSDVNYWIIFIGIITLLLSEVFRSGAALKEDVDLTI